MQEDCINFQVLIVTGGGSPVTDRLRTTEIFNPSIRKWVISGAKLFRKLDGLRATNIDDRVLIFGELT